MFVKLFLLSIILVAFSIILFSIKILLSKIVLDKPGKFPNTSIGGNKHLRQKGIKCPKHEECKISGKRCS
jgi:hypothetical protein